MSRIVAVFLLIVALVGVAGLVYLFMKDTARQTEIAALQRRVEANRDDTSAKFASGQKAFDDLKAQVSELSGRLSAQEQALTELKSAAAELKNELITAMTSKLSKEMVAAATDQAIAKSIAEFEASRGPQFFGDLGNELVQHHRAELTGPPGRNVDDERVAHFLLAQPDFLTAVSITLIQQQEKQ